MTLYTIGYEDSDIDEFIEYLVKKKIKAIADVRKNPVSRKRGFSKNKLAERLEEKGIQYFSFRGLGVPSDWRKRAREKNITREKMFNDYREKILPEHLDELKEIAELLQSKKTALLCYECAADDCHRRKVSDRLRRSFRGKLKVVDLYLRANPNATTGIPPLRKGRFSITFQPRGRTNFPFTTLAGSKK